jgi:hypothetical protein
MSIDRETFENAEEGELEEFSIPDQVLGFLATHDEQAFKPREIAARIEVDEGAVSTALSRLKNRDLVEHKGTYWAVTTDEERLKGYSGYERATALFSDILRAVNGAASPHRRKAEALGIYVRTPTNTGSATPPLLLSRGGFGGT